MAILNSVKFAFKTAVAIFRATIWGDWATFIPTYGHTDVDSNFFLPEAIFCSALKLYLVANYKLTN